MIYQAFESDEWLAETMTSILTSLRHLTRLRACLGGVGGGGGGGEEKKARVFPSLPLISTPQSSNQKYRQLPPPPIMNKKCITYNIWHIE